MCSMIAPTEFSYNHKWNNNQHPFRQHPYHTADNQDDCQRHNRNQKTIHCILIQFPVTGFNGILLNQPATEFPQNMLHYFCLLKRDNSFGALGWYAKKHAVEFASTFNTFVSVFAAIVASLPVVFFFVFTNTPPFNKMVCNNFIVINCIITYFLQEIDRYDMDGVFFTLFGHVHSILSLFYIYFRTK